ncbi:WxL domain-containing protein [Enterococcus sp. 669A]|uniref:WxL domain-containing protein n=1 Tax=Candidatus Enterococcus moelleringii TaxID=2815325 RepID=A0ABS3L7J5_9ENTE|nr:WxL domain-containing protein [Enterococcus sp. 669A]MBO1305028.1 WxL domain-containing protein [Enterococcus sp. 669A]
MKKKVTKLFFSTILIFSLLFSPAAFYSFASEKELPEDNLELLLNGEASAEIQESDTQVTLSFTYQTLALSTENSLPEPTKTTEELLLELPKGVSYESEKNSQLDSAIQQEERTLTIDLSQAKDQSAVVLTVNPEELTVSSEISGKLSVVGSTVGQASAELTKSTTEAEESQSSKAAAPSANDAPIQEVAPLAEGDLELGIPTQRTLPIAPVTQDQYANVSYFDVGSRAEWDAALTTANNNAQEITYINITQDFQMSAVTTVVDGAQIATTTRADKKLVVEGNGHTIDFRDLTMRFNGANWDLVFQNLNVFNANDWGIADAYNVTGFPIITVHNYVQYGGQAFEGSRGKIIISGNTSMTSSNTESYVSPIDQQTVQSDQRFVGGNGSSNVEVGEVYIKTGSTIRMDNGRYGSNFSVATGGNFYIEDGAQTELTLSNLEQPLSPNGWGGYQDYSPSNISIVAGISAQPWPANYRPASLQGRTNSIYFGDNAAVTMENGAARRRNAGLIQFMLGNGLFELGDNASFNGYIAENTAGGGLFLSPMFFSGGGTIVLGDNADFNLTVGQLPDAVGSNEFGTVTGDAIYFAGLGSIQIGTGADFRLRSASTTTTGLIFMPTAPSSIQLADQATFDVGFLQPAANPLIYLFGNIRVPQTGNYVHQIGNWTSGQFGDTPSELFRPLDQTVLTYAGTVVTGRQTQVAATFADNGVVGRFSTDFTSSAQRLLIRPLVQEVESIDPITNQTQSEYTVTGTAQPPGEPVELSGGPFDDPSLTAAQKQTVIQDDGTYQWQGALPRPFYYGDTIRATYVRDTAKYAETAVQDVTAPTGTGRTVHVAENTMIPNAETFIASVADTNPAQTDKAAFNYRLVNGTIAAGTPAAISTEEETQTYQDQVIIDDTRGNESEPVDVTLVVHRADTINTIRANNLTRRYSDVAEFEVGSAGYESYLLGQLNATAQTIVDGEIVDLTAEVTIGNLASIPTDVGGPYPIQLVVPATAQNQLAQDLTTTVNLSVLSNIVNPRDPSSSEFIEDPENQGTGENGDLRLDYVPTLFDFGAGVIQWTDRTYSAQGTDDQWVQISDNRNNESGWELKASATPFESGSDQLLGASLILPQGEIYNRNSGGTVDPTGLVSQGAVPLTTSPTTLLTGDGANSKDESTYVWKKNQVQLRVPRGQGQAGETYQSTITWIVEAGAAN